MRENELLVNKKKRNELIERIEILDSVGEILLLGNTEFATTEMVANYYEVTQRHIEDIINKNRDELESDGFGIRKANDFISELKFGNKVSKQKGKFLVKINEDEIISFAPRGVNLFPKRAILRVGMLLQDSSIAKELRTRLLDIIHDAEEKTDIVKDIIAEIRTEQDIQAELLKAGENMRQIFLDNLPKKNGLGRNKEKQVIDWEKSVGFKVYFIYDDITGYIDIMSYDRVNKKIVIKYRGVTYEQKPISTTHLLKCSLGYYIGKKTNTFKYKIGTNIIDNRRDMIIIDREYRVNPNKRNLKFYKYNCNKCNNEDWITEYSLINNLSGCSVCNSSRPKPVLGINTIWDTDRWMIDLGVSEEDAKTHTKSSHDTVKIICKNCGKEKEIQINQIYNKKSIGCSCGDGRSYISKYILNILTQLGVCYKTEVKYDWNKYINPKNNKLTQASIDFVIYKDGREIPLEADGDFHRKDNKMTGMTAKMQQDIDKQRDENCLKYLGEETIRISDEGDVKENILKSKLNELFDLSQVDWSKCEEFAIKNIVKEVCNYWNNKEEWETTSDLATLFNVNPITIKRYLSKGAKLSWCSYL